jgi:hypothetical protein
MTWQSEAQSAIEIERKVAVMTTDGAGEWPPDCSVRRCEHPTAADGLCMTHLCAGWQACRTCRTGRACSRHASYDMD